MLTGLMLLILAGAGIVGFVKKHILRIKDPDLNHYLAELKKQSWYQEFVNDPQSSGLIQSFEKSGPLKDVHYVQKLLVNDGFRDGFIAYIKEKTR